VSRLDTAGIVPLLAVVAFASLGAYLQFNTHLNHDIAWILYSAGRLLEGERFGRDVIAANPPLAWWLSYPALILGEHFGLHPATAFRLQTMLLAATVILLCRSILLSRDELSGWHQSLFLVLAGYWLFLGSFRDFGQREYLAAAFVLPYLLIAALRIENHRVSPWHAALAGIAAGIGFSLKPYFLAAFVLVELSKLLSTRRGGSLVQPESLAAVATALAYAGAIIVWVPDYLGYAVPLIRPVYFGFETPITAVLSRIWLPVAGVVALAVWAFRSRLSAMELALTAAAAGFLISYVVQMKGYSYHAYPSYVLISLALASASVRELTRSRIAGSKARAAPKLFGILLAALFGLSVVNGWTWYSHFNRQAGPLGHYTDTVVQVIESNGAKGRFLVLSTHPFPAFPVALHTTAKWVSRTNSQLFLPAVAKLRNIEDPARRDLLRYAEKQAGEFLVRDLLLWPDVLLVDSRASHHGIAGEFDILSFYLENPIVRKLWTGYREIEPRLDYRVFVRAPAEGSR
jgi:hypothetical protein